MLSENLLALHDRFAEYKGTGCEMQPKAIELICATLIVAAQDAAELESRTVPLADQVEQFPDNVVVFERPRQVRPNQGRGPGGAA